MCFHFLCTVKSKVERQLLYVVTIATPCLIPIVIFQFPELYFVSRGYFVIVVIYHLQSYI